MESLTGDGGDWPGITLRPDGSGRPGPVGCVTHTYTVLGRCGRTGMLGMALTTSSIAVGARCAWVEAGAGAVATQHVTDPRLGRLGLDLLRRGYAAAAVVDELVRAGAYADHRQLACVDRDGLSAAWTGSLVTGAHAQRTERNLAAVGNLLQAATVIDAIAETFLAEPALPLAERLVRALAAGKAAGGERGRDERSAALVVHDRESFPLVDLRVDWDEGDPVATLASLWARYRPDLETFRARAIDPPSVWRPRA